MKEEGKWYCNRCLSRISEEEHAEFGGNCEDCDDIIQEQKLESKEGYDPELDDY